jgi:hypothetical protein
MKSKFVYRQKVVDLCLISFLQLYALTSGARPVLPMGVAPEAIADFFLL